jgi:carbon-monoxide dehydrogenase large subunit
MGEHFRGRREDLRLLTGGGLYAADRHFDGEAHAVFLRADRAHAEIASIAVEAARAMPGVLAVLTGADTKAAGYGSAAPLVVYPGRGGSKMLNPRRQVLAEDRVRYVGQEVALVVAQTAQQAQVALEAIVVDYNDLPPVIDLDAALSNETLLYPELGTNLAFDFDYGDEAAVTAAVEGAAHVTRVELDLPRLVGNPMEPKSATVCFDAETGRYDIYSPTQGMTLMRDSLATGTGVSVDLIKVHAKDVGGGFGVRTEGYSEYCALMLAAKMLGRPVKWTGTRAETFVSDHHARAAKLSGELALDADGKFLALGVQWIVHGGGYLSQAGPLINTMPPRSHMAGLYRIPKLYGRHKLLLTNTTPTTAYRGAGRPNVSYLLERLVDQAALETGRDRVELRRKNLIAKSDFPYTTAVGAVYDSGDPEAMLDIAVKESNWSGFAARREDSKKRG